MIKALEQIRRMRGGAQSHLMRCSDENYYVVKFQNNPQHRRILVNELLGTRLASRLGLPTAAVEVVEVGAELIHLTPELCRAAEVADAVRRGAAVRLALSGGSAAHDPARFSAG